MLTSEKLIIETPEQIPLEFHLAGLGSRALALVIDCLIQVAVFLLLYFGVLMAGALLLPHISSWESSGKWMIAGLILIVFTIYWGYYAFFETIWKGQTPGKRVAHIRVIKKTGRPITAFEAISRNLMRTIDFNGPGIIAVFLSKHNCRLGDMVAGTVVVHESQQETTAPIWIEPANQPTAPKFDVNKLSNRELEIIETFLQRKLDLPPEVRQATAEKITLNLIAKMGLPQHVVGYAIDQWKPEQFLEQIAIDLRTVSRYR